MKKLDLSTVPTFYQRYVSLVDELEMMEALSSSRGEMNQLIDGLSADQENYAYGPGKWTIKELLCHVIDAERIFVYRALCFSRNDKNNLPGFDENAYVPESNATQRTLADIKQEFNNLRTSTIDFFSHCTPLMLSRSGTANNTTISVAALGYVVAGHQMHHLNVLKDRYLKK
jgi:hypothetical protein